MRVQRRRLRHYPGRGTWADRAPVRGAFGSEYFPTSSQGLLAVCDAEFRRFFDLEGVREVDLCLSDEDPGGADRYEVRAYLGVRHNCMLAVHRERRVDRREVYPGVRHAVLEAAGPGGRAFLWVEVVR